MNRFFASLLLIATAFAADTKPALQTKTFKGPGLFPGARPSPAPVAPADPFAKPAPAAPADPFGKPDVTPPGDPIPPVNTARETLEHNGIKLPPGSEVTFDPTTSELIVTSTADALEEIEALAHYDDSAPKTMGFLLHVIQVPADQARLVAQQASLTNDQSADLAKLTEAAAQKDSEVRVVSSAYVETKPGSRCLVQAVRQHRWAVEVNMTKDGHLGAITEAKDLGLSFELDPVLGPDGQTIDLTFALSASPSWVKEESLQVSDLASGKDIVSPASIFNEQKINTNMVVINGRSRLIANWKLAGTESAWLVFLTPRVIAHVAGPSAVAVVSAQTLPPGWKCAVFPVPAHLGGDGAGWRNPGETVESYFKRRGIVLPKGSIIDADANGFLRVTSTLPVLERVSVIADEVTSKAPRQIALTFHTVRAPGPMLRALAASASTTNDASAALQTVLDAVVKNEATMLSTNTFETKPGNKASQNSIIEARCLEDFEGIDPKKPKERVLRPETHEEGLRIEVDPVIGPDGQTIDLTVSFQHSTAPGEHRDAVFRDPATAKNYTLPFVDLHEAKVNCAISLMSGKTRLLGLWRPTGKPEFEREDVMEAVFITARAVPLVVEMIGYVPEPIKADQPADRNDKTLYTRLYKVYPDFNQFDDAQAPNQPIRRRQSAREVLEMHGIPFPEGATAYVGGVSGKLVVRNTLTNLELVETFLDSFHYCEVHSNPNFNVQLFEAPSPVLRRLLVSIATQTNHRTLLQALTDAQARHEATALTSLTIETKSGHRAIAEETTTREFINELGTDANGTTYFNKESRALGTSFEVDPVIGPDGYTIDLNFALKHNGSDAFEAKDERFTDPMTGREITFPLPRIAQFEQRTAITLMHDTTRLLGVWRPTGKAYEGKDVLHCALLTARIVRAEVEEKGR